MPPHPWASEERNRGKRGPDSLAFQLSGRGKVNCHVVSAWPFQSRKGTQKEGVAGSLRTGKSGFLKIQDREGGIMLQEVCGTKL